MLTRALAVCGRRGMSFAFLTFVVAFAALTALRLSDNVPSCKVGSLQRDDVTAEAGRCAGDVRAGARVEWWSVTCSVCLFVATLDVCLRGHFTAECRATLSRQRLQRGVPIKSQQLIAQSLQFYQLFAFVP